MNLQEVKWKLVMISISLYLVSINYVLLMSGVTVIGKHSVNVV